MTSSVECANSEYTARKAQWKRARDVLAGQDQVYLGGTEYLPKLSGQSDDEYLAYMRRATFFNAAGRTLDGLSGMVFAKAPRKKLPTGMEPWVRDITLDGCSLEGFAKAAVEEQLTVGRLGIMVDYPADDVGLVTVGMAQALNLRPYMRQYKAENLVDWRMGRVRGAQALTMVKLFERVEEPGADEFMVSSVEQYRVLDLVEGRYRVRIFRKSEAGEWAPISEAFPLEGGAPMDYIPFVIVNVSGCGPNLEKPPLLDLIDANLAHYRNTADFEHGLHFAGLPTPYCFGVTLGEGETLKIGGTAAWTDNNHEAKAGFLEFTGQGLDPLAKALTAKEQRMAVLGARMLAEEKRSAESTETTQIKHSGEHSVLASLAKTAAEGIRRALEMMSKWSGQQGDIEFSLNIDYGIRRLSAPEILALVQGWQQGAYSKQTLFQNLQAGQVISEDASFEVEEARIGDSGPAVPASASQPFTGLRKSVQDLLRG